MNIKTVAKNTGLTAHTLRYYEKIGLLINIHRDLSGHRVYSEKDLIWIAFIKRLKATNMPLEEIKQFASLRVQGDKTIPERVALLEKHAQRVEKQIQTLKTHQQKIVQKIELCLQGGALT